MNRIALIVFVMALLLAGSAFGQECLEADPVLMFDTSSNCASQPSIDRVFGAERFSWGAGDYLAVNVGNDIRIYDVSDPSSPQYSTQSHFRAPVMGDKDYGLQNFSVCDGCRFGVANFVTGSAFFDFGTGNKPRFTEHVLDESARLIPGAFVFTHGAATFLVAEHGDCPGSALYRYSSIDARQKLECLTGPSRPARIVRGTKIGSALYLTDSTSAVHLYRFDGAHLLYVDSPWEAYGIKGSGMDCRGEVCAVANSGGLEIWNVSDPLAPNVVAAIDGDWNRAVITGDLVTVAKKGHVNSEQTFRLCDLSEVACDFWEADRWWNWPSHQCSEVQAMTASQDGSSMYLMRYSRMQRIEIGDCPPPAATVFTDGFESGTTARWSSTGG